MAMNDIPSEYTPGLAEIAEAMNAVIVPSTSGVVHILGSELAGIIERNQTEYDELVRSLAESLEASRVERERQAALRGRGRGLRRREPR